MRIEVLYPELGNLYGDGQNMRYLGLCVPEAEFLQTHLPDVPAFVTRPVDLVYLGPLTERGQQRVVAALMPYRTRIQELIEGGTVFLFTGNAFEVLCTRITNVTQGCETSGLGIFDLQVSTDLFARFNGKVLGDLAGVPVGTVGATGDGIGAVGRTVMPNIEIVGFKSQFSQVVGDNSASYFVRCIRGAGLNTQSQLEGLHINNFFGTSLLGPLLILNPLFTRHLLRLLGVAQPTLAFEDAIISAYNERLKEFKDPKTAGFDGKGH
ncbi:MAG: glutamine amidotransferase [Coriobacteriales bacterium]|nr:glutamine amidotransferase [Coriobacteriales bacterium]